MYILGGGVSIQHLDAQLSVGSGGEVREDALRFEGPRGSPVFRYDDM